MSVHEDAALSTSQRVLGQSFVSCNTMILIILTRTYSFIVVALYFIFYSCYSSFILVEGTNSG